MSAPMVAGWIGWASDWDGAMLQARYWAHQARMRYAVRRRGDGRWVYCPVGVSSSIFWDWTR